MKIALILVLLVIMTGCGIRYEVDSWLQKELIEVHGGRNEDIQVISLIGSPDERIVIIKDDVYFINVMRLGGAIQIQQKLDIKVSEPEINL